MKKGISTNRRTTAHLACLRAGGTDFIVRYYSATTTQPEKRLTLSEAQAISAANMAIVACYEDRPTDPSYFTNSRGHLDALNAYHTATEMLQPKDSAIYFTVDYDATQSQIAQPISDYFRGVQRGFTDAAQGGAPLYKIGVYGSGACCDWVKRHLKIAAYSWVAESTKWFGTASYTDFDLKQFIAATDLCSFTGGIGGSYEPNEGEDDIGAFRITVPEKITDAVELMITDHAAAPAPLPIAAAPPTPADAATGWAARFNMKLQMSSELIVGTLSITNGSGSVVLALPATSGLQGHQDITNLWEIKHGPIPPNEAGNAIETLERSTPVIRREFRIRPETVTQPMQPHVTRGAFRAHHEFGTHGSEGCIAIISEADFERFADLMHHLNNHETEIIPLAFHYA